jgi:hypothetical protein
MMPPWLYPLNYNLPYGSMDHLKLLPALANQVLKLGEAAH